MMDTLCGAMWASPSTILNHPRIECVGTGIARPRTADCRPYHPAPDRNRIRRVEFAPALIKSQNKSTRLHRVGCYFIPTFSLYKLFCRGQSIPSGRREPAAYTAAGRRISGGTARARPGAQMPRGHQYRGSFCPLSTPSAASPQTGCLHFVGFYVILV